MWTATFTLAQELCANVYAASPAVSTSVSSAIAAATSAAKADVAGKDVTDQSIYPQCVVRQSPAPSLRLLPLKSKPEDGIARPRELTYASTASLPKTKWPQRDLRLPRQPHLRLPELRPRPRDRVVRGRQL